MDFLLIWFNWKERIHYIIVKQINLIGVMESNLVVVQINIVYIYNQPFWLYLILRQVIFVSLL